MDRVLGDTPRRLRLLTVGSVALGVGFALLGSFGLARRESALKDVRDAARELIDVQDVRVRLIHADALAAENFLRAGLENPDVRAEYESEIAAATEELSVVTNRLPDADAATISGVASDVAVYTGLVEQARANNRQGLPVGSAYLRQAGALMADQLGPRLVTVEVALRTRVNERLDRADRAGAWLHLAGWPLMALLVLGGLWLSRRFKRNVNLGVAFAGAVALVILLYGAAAQHSAMNDAEQVAEGPLHTADLLSQTRAAAFDGRRQEAATLINRGNGADAEARWAQADADASAALAELCALDACGDASARYDTYRSTYTAVRSLDNDKGQWDAAVALSLSQGATAFNAVANALQRDAAVAVTSSDRQLAGATDGFGSDRLLVLIGGLAAAAAAAAGIGQRSKEYR